MRRLALYRRYHNALLLCCFSLLAAADSFVTFRGDWSLTPPSEFSGRRLKFCNEPGTLPLKQSTVLMGIKGFRSWFEAQFPDAIISIPRNGSNDTFDHVLVDMNQLLHQCVRKSRTEGHGLTLLIKELDAVTSMATPTQSLVLAMDGPPSAAKLATQRKRRFATLIKAQLRLQRIDKLGSKRMSAAKLTRKKRKVAADTKTLCITPGTDFMRRAEQAVLYWAWQRMTSNHSKLRHVKVFLSPSTVAGEGEVKLLEWLYQKNRRGESVAILGGDSDLVLEGLMVPPASTHNVHILAQDGSKQYLCVSCWEVTRSLVDQIPHVTPANVMKYRSDLVLLLILNGNDYLPKLRGSSGFSILYRTYTRLQRQWYSDGKADEAYIVDADTLDFNLPFCIEYFSRFSAPVPDDVRAKNAAREGQRSLSELNNLIDEGYLPKPVKVEVIEHNDINGDAEIATATLASTEDDAHASTDGDEEEDDEDIDEDIGVRVRMSLGDPESDDYLVYETICSPGKKMRQMEDKLARMAIDALYDNDEEEADDDDDDEDDVFVGIDSQGYDWELKRPVDANVDDFLRGILWNLRTYQEGVCADYGYNYGKRRAPTARDLVQRFQRSSNETTKLGWRTIVTGNFTRPIGAGPSCLAALPSLVKHLVPVPYAWVADETVESMYSECMDPSTNIFDIGRFEKLCETSVAEFKGVLPANGTGLDDQLSGHGRRIMGGDHHWTVVGRVPKPLTHQFDPPVPFSDRMSRLRKDACIRVSHLIATNEPRPRAAWGASVEKPKRGFVNKGNALVAQGDSGFIGRKFNDVHAVLHVRAYAELRKKPARNVRAKIDVRVPILPSQKVANGKIAKPAMQASRNAGKDSGTQNTLQPSTTKEEKRDASTGLIESLKGLTLADGATPVAILKELEDAKLVSGVSWDEPKASNSQQADTICLVVCAGTSNNDKANSNAVSLQRNRVHGKHTETKQVARQKLAFQALEILLQTDKEHLEKMTAGDIKKCLAQKISAE